MLTEIMFWRSMHDGVDIFTKLRILADFLEERGESFRSTACQMIANKGYTPRQCKHYGYTSFDWRLEDGRLSGVSHEVFVCLYRWPWPLSRGDTRGHPTLVAAYQNLVNAYAKMLSRPPIGKVYTVSRGKHAGLSAPVLRHTAKHIVLSTDSGLVNIHERLL